MTFHQQDKHTSKVESSLSPWIRNPRKQVQEAGGDSAVQDAASAALRPLPSPPGCGWQEGGGSSAAQGLISVIYMQQVFREGGWGVVPKSSSPRRPFNQDQKEAVSMAVLERVSRGTTSLWWLV